MDAWFLVFSVAITSIGAYLVGRSRLRLEGRSLARAAVRMIECLGIAAAFFLVNTLVGIAVILTLRATGSGFVALYVMSDEVLIPLSLVQGLVFWWWRAGP